ncbi:uncharacterized protein PV09_08835 [Verruconis gallopava]|uniref:GED domain-containing protein n=1 Tax=Verruconis gallopava TaxID=253628 RepID=A0A0D2AKL6_9PEZI|nr:uncharacterized protein PV09_08835 [Verruconis gallopava]KIV99533.1 hypothetical protein PV09_08835 [Verruconis gallopava]
MSFPFNPHKAAGALRSLTSQSFSEQDTLEGLLGADTNELLNLVDQLRRKGIHEEVPLPQIIVVGDQSSGKSSVLEALSHLQFPRGATLCTTFATKLALRKKQTTSVHVHIVPDKFRPEAERQQLKSWEPDSTELSEFQSIVTSAGKHIRNFGHAQKDSYSNDVLHIEVSGPRYPQLTLVDLPGLTRRPNENQSPDDPGKCREIVESYIADPSTIILAIVDASIELVRQDPFNLIKKYDENGNRTIGVITKPDRASPSIVEDYMDYARNTKLPLKYGWHVLRNRDEESEDWSSEQRDIAEASFFRTSRWGALEATQLGANSLRTALSQHLEQKIRDILPTMIPKIQSTLKSLKTQRDVLGPPRTSVDEQRRHLNRIADDFTSYIRRGMEGRADPELKLIEYTGFSTLRSNINSLNNYFINELRSQPFSSMVLGPPENVSDPLSAVRDFTISDETFQEVKLIHQINQPIGSQRGVVDRNILSSVLLQRVINSGEGSWKDIAEKHIQNVCEAVAKHVRAIVDYTAGNETATNLQLYHIDDELAKKNELLQEKLSELLKPIQQNWGSSTLNLLWDAPHRSLKSSVARANVGKSSGDVESDYELAIRETALHYVIMLGSFLDNVSLLVVEMNMIQDLPNLFNASGVAKMSKEKLHILAAEPGVQQHRRNQLDSKIDDLEQSIKLCREYALGAYKTASKRSADAKLGGYVHDYRFRASPLPLDSDEVTLSPQPIQSNLTSSEAKLAVEHGTKDSVKTSLRGIVSTDNKDDCHSSSSDTSNLSSSNIV